MLKSVNPKSRLWTCLALLAIVVACGGDPEEEDWQSAKMKRSAEGYEQYLAQHPEGVFAQEAREMLEAVHFKQTQKENTLEAAESFLEQHPDGLHAEEIRKTQELLHWAQAQRAKTLAAYKSFLKLYPEGRFAQEAQGKMAPFALAQIMGGDVKAYENFLERFPEGPAAESARKTLERLRSQQGTSK
jgi:regulator of sirC expression with transglutaminase-like and TPR domain